MLRADAPLYQQSAPRPMRTTIASLQNAWYSFRETLCFVRAPPLRHTARAAGRKMDSGAIE
jgi:hypothetical protein